MSAGALAAVLVDVPAAAFDATVAFWAGALSATPEYPAEDYVFLAGATAVTDVLVQRIDGPPRFHLDVAVPDRADAVQRAVGLGGAIVQRDEDWDVVADPAGLPVCIGFEDPDPDLVRTAPRRDGLGYLDAVFLDVPASASDAEVAFWADLFGAAPHPPEPDDPAYRLLEGVLAVGGAHVGLDVQTVAVDPTRDGSAAAPRIHVDLSAPDVLRETARLEGIGARRVAEVDDWVTLADPAGNLLCVVPSPPP